MCPRAMQAPQAPRCRRLRSSSGVVPPTPSLLGVFPMPSSPPTIRRHSTTPSSSLPLSDAPSHPFPCTLSHHSPTIRFQVEQYNLIVVVGASDEAAGVVTVRARDDGMAAAVRGVMLQAGLSPTEGFGVLPDHHTTVMTCEQLVAVCAALTKAFQ